MFYHRCLCDPFHCRPSQCSYSGSLPHSVFVAVHSSSFLTVELDGLPAMVAPTLEDIFTLRSGGTLGSWASTSRTVFEKLSEPLSKVHLGAAVTTVSKTAGEAIGLARQFVDALDVFTSQYLSLTTAAYITFKFLHFRVFD